MQDDFFYGTGLAKIVRDAEADEGVVRPVHAGAAGEGRASRRSVLDSTEARERLSLEFHAFVPRLTGA